MINQSSLDSNQAQAPQSIIVARSDLDYVGARILKQFATIGQPDRSNVQPLAGGLLFVTRPSLAVHDHRQRAH
jgi:hypothetical protein